MKRVRRRKCTYWEFKYAKWSDDGCYELRGKSTETMTACECYHLTDFAIAVEIGKISFIYDISVLSLRWSLPNFISRTVR